MRRLQKILAARHVADLLLRIVYDNRKVVGSAYILARKDDIAEGIEQGFRGKPMFSCMRMRRFLEPDFPNGIRSAKESDRLANVQANCI